MVRPRSWLVLVGAALVVLAGPEVEAKKKKKKKNKAVAKAEEEVRARAEAWFEARQGFEPRLFPKEKVAAATYPFLPPTFQSRFSEEEWLSRLFSHATNGNDRKDPLLEGEGGFSIPLSSAVIDTIHIHRDCATVDATVVFLADKEELPTKHRTVWVKQEKEWYLAYRKAEHWLIAARSWHDRANTNQKNSRYSVLGAPPSETVLKKGMDRKAFSGLQLAAKLDEIAHDAYKLEGKDKHETQAKREALGAKINGKVKVSDVGVVLSVTEAKQGGTYVIEVLCGRLIALIPFKEGDQRMLGMRLSFTGMFAMAEPRMGGVIEQPWVLEQPRGTGKSSTKLADRYPSACIRAVLTPGTKVKLEK